MSRFRVHPRIESPDSIRPVFWISTRGVLPPTEMPAAAENASPSRLMPTSVSDGSAFISTNSQLVSLSGSQTTCVTPFFFISFSTVSGLRPAFCASVTMWSLRWNGSLYFTEMARNHRKLPRRKGTRVVQDHTPTLAVKHDRGTCSECCCYRPALWQNRTVTALSLRVVVLRVE